MSARARQAKDAAEKRIEERRVRSREAKERRIEELESLKSAPFFTRISDLEPIRLSVVRGFINRRLKDEVPDIEKFLDRRLHLLCGMTLRNAIRLDYSLVKGWMLDVRLKPDDREIQLREFESKGEITS